jgi:cardiolipin synthase
MPFLGSCVLAALAVVGSSCARVAQPLTLPHLDTGKPSFVSTMEAYSGSAVVGGNRIELLLNGDQIFPAKLAAIKAAKKNINFAQYVFEEGQASADIARALAQRCQEGLAVHVLLDAVGSLNIPGEYRQVMVDGGCHVESFRPLSSFAFDRLNYRNHRRIMVVDGRLGITGGSGLSGKWSGNGLTEGHWRDTDVLVEGPVVEQLQAAFVENWLEATGVALGGDDYFPALGQRGPLQAQIVRSSPAGGSAAMYSTFLLAMAASKKSIYITNPYFVPDDKMIQTLIRAAQRGVRVVLLIPGAIDHNIVRQASRAELGRLLKAGVEVYEYQAALLHAKTMVIDGVWATVGSTNLDRRSFALNDELNLVVYNDGVAAKLRTVFEQDLQHSRQVTYESWSKRSIVDRFLEVLAQPLRDQL